MTNELESWRARKLESSDYNDDDDDGQEGLEGQEETGGDRRRKGQASELTDERRETGLE